MLSDLVIQRIMWSPILLKERRRLEAFGEWENQRISRILSLQSRNHVVKYSMVKVLGESVNALFAESQNQMSKVHMF